MTKAQVTRLIRYWQKQLLLHEWKITIHYGPNPEERAGLFAHPEYGEADFHWDPAQVKLDSQEEADRWVIHELMHAHQWRLEQAAENWAGEDEALYNTVRDIAETTCTQLERAFYHVATMPRRRKRAA